MARPIIQFTTSLASIIYYDVAVVEYVTATVSPDVTDLDVAKLPSEYNVPAVELNVLTAPEPVTRKQPYTVPPAPVIV